jgi:glycosyltransferase involved in cell wall biosynthesis
MSRYDELLLISRAEVAITGGLGLDSRYYPYVPVGAIRQRNEQIRRRRASASFEPGLFILMGSARHYPTRRSLEWFVGSACRHGLPAGVHVITLGHDTNALAARREIPAGLELWGWLGQEELDDLLGRAPAVLIPQKLGFGALTRLPELACAGVPVVTTAYPTYAIDPTPGIHVVEGGWDAWCAAMAQLAREEPPQLEACYQQWEGRQPRTLNDVLSQYSEHSMSRAALSR